MTRPVWLFSLDTENFKAPPMTTGGLAAHFARFGRSSDSTEITLQHFLSSAEALDYFRRRWALEGAPRVASALAAGEQPVVGFSLYTWNAAEFLEGIRLIRELSPGVRVLAGGPHVQRPEAMLLEDGIDVIALGEAEVTFTELLDHAPDAPLDPIAGLAFVRDGQVVRTAERPRQKELSAFPSALEVVPLRDADGRPRYEHVAYETSRGCPFKCAFCEWGTGAIGTKMYQHTLERIRSDMETLVAAGVKDIWLCDSNFGALREDLEKVKIVIDLKQRTGLPSTFATSWSKQHNARVQEIVLLLHQHGLLQHYNLALQTLTPLALQLANRTNMRSNEYEPIAERMLESGVPIATELIWGLPGDNLAEFERNLDKLSVTFPNINIFGYTLLPGTEFADRREEYKIRTIPVAGYGKAKGEYVIASHTFEPDEGIEGYFLIAAHIVLVRGYIVPLSARYAALSRGVAMSPLLRRLLRVLADHVQPRMPEIDLSDRMNVYEHRAQVYLEVLRDAKASFAAVEAELCRWLEEQGASAEHIRRARAVLELDELFCPRVGPSVVERRSFHFDAPAVEHELARMRLPAEGSFAPAQTAFTVTHPAGAGEVLKDPDGGSWMRGRILEAERPQTGMVQLRRPAATN